MVEFSVLGPLTVRSAGHTVLLPALKQRRLLALLLSRHGQPISADLLMYELWDGEPPATARKTLQVYVHRLRQALGNAVQHGPSGYYSAGQVDSDRFAQFVEQAREARRQGRAQAAVDLYCEALELWRGEPYADVASGELLLEEVQRLNEQCLQAKEELFECHLELGHHSQVVGELTVLTGQYPFREGLRALLMLALYRAGRQAEALEVYRETRRVMVEELGVEPSPVLQRLHASLLRGEEHLHHFGVSADSAKPAQLPVGTAAFTGRSAALESLDRLLPQDDSPPATVIVTIAGTAGIGKTSLALHWAHRNAGRFPDGQLYVNLRGFDPEQSILSPAEAIRGFLDGLRVPTERLPVGLQAQAAFYRSAMAGKRALVVLDNARDAEQVRPLLPGSPGCMVLVTSRNQMPGLVAAQGAYPLTLDLLTLAEARELLARRIGASRMAAEPEAADEIIEFCARLPLALAVAAARAVIQPGLTLAALAAELREARDWNHPFSSDDPVTDLRAVFSWSYMSLSGAAARLFRLLGLHPGPDVGTDAAASLVGFSLGRTRQALGELVEACLINEQGLDRYWCHDLLRAYAHELVTTVDTPENKRAAQTRQLDHYLHSGQLAAMLLTPKREPLSLPEPADSVVVSEIPDALSWFAAEHPILVTLAEQAEKSGWDEQSGRLAWILADFLQRDARWQECVTVQTAALSSASRLEDLPGQARAHRGLARAFARLERPDDAQLHLQAALGVAIELGDDLGRAHTHRDMGWLLGHLKQYEDAVRHSEQARDLHRAAGRTSGEASALNAIGWYQAQLGRYPEALENCTRSLELQLELEDGGGQAEAWDSLGYIHLQSGDYRQATVCYERAADLLREAGDRFYLALALDRLGDSHLAGGDPVQARSAWERALRIYTELGHAMAAEAQSKLDGLAG